MSGWSYTGTDQGLTVFTAALQACGEHMPVSDGSTLLDVGCNEADWVGLAHMAWPDAVIGGLDWRATDWDSDDAMAWKRKGNGLAPNTFAPESFDGIVGVSAFEHFGLGHYSRDPRDPDGDTHVLANCWRWLKPGGWLYFDVPYDPRGYRIVNKTEYRTYDDAAVERRLWMEPLAAAKAWGAERLWTGYVHVSHCDQVIEKPTTQETDALAYYLAIVARKCA